MDPALSSTPTLNQPRPQAPLKSLEDLLVDELPRLRAFIARLVGQRIPRIDPDDLAQETAARALRYRDSFDANRPLGPWLAKTALRLYLDRRAALLRDQEQQFELGRSLEAREARPQTRLEDRESLARCAARLSARELDILLRFHQRGETLLEIAAALGMPVGTVKSHLHRARRNLVRGDE